MQNLYTLVARREPSEEVFSNSEISSVLYHDIFDYPLTFAELIKWQVEESTPISNVESAVSQKNGYFFLEGHEGLVYKRLLRKRVSVKKMEIARKACRILSFIPSVKMVAVTGSLAMQNSMEDGDIDLMIITRRGALWTTRLVSYLVTRLFGIKTRKPGDKDQKDKLCLNMWFDESDLIWRDRNIYAAHEIAQIAPLVNKDKTYEKFLYKNKWILNFWPSAVPIKNLKFKFNNKTSGLVEKVCYWMQKLYMKPKMTREVVTSTRALFHPQDWGKLVLSRLSS